jgi:hypothetical protein
VTQLGGAKPGVRFENLEARALLSGTPLGVEKVSYLGGTQLRITGTAAADAITVSRTSTGVLLGNTGGWTRKISGTFNSIVIDGGSGSDSITLGATVKTPAVVHGSDGDDSIIGGGGNDRIYGGAGRDVIDGRAGNDTIVAIGGGTRDSVIGGEGRDSFWTDTTDKVAATNDEWAGNAVHLVGSFLPSSSSPMSSTTVSKESLGQDLTDPTLSGSGMTYANFSDRPLFSSKGPSANDVKQGAVGDCYYLAVLSSVAKVDPRLIRDSVVDMGDGTFAVRFFHDNTAEYVRVDADFATYADGSLAYAGAGAQGSMWVAVMEKAFTIFRSGDGAYASIAGGWMSEAYRAVGAAATASYSSASASWLIDSIRNDLKAGKSVTYAANKPGSAPLIAAHAYMVDAIVTNSAGQAIGIRLRNPWGTDGAGDDGNDDGYVTITAAQAQASFLGLASAWV